MHKDVERQGSTSAADPPGRSPASEPPSRHEIEPGLSNAVVARTVGPRAASPNPFKAASLPGGTRDRFGGAFEHDFSSVRVHPESDRTSSRQLAVTEGRDVHFAPGAYAPGTESGDALIAHELAHVVQQSKGPAAAAPLAPKRALEADADRAAGEALAGRRAGPLLGASAGQPQAYEAWEHAELGDADGGKGVTVVTTSGVRLTYGQMVALSGDFYRSPEALMNAPADELRKILAAMETEKAQVAASLAKEAAVDDPSTKDKDESVDENGHPINKDKTRRGVPTDEELVANNAAYELATAGSARAKHHEHTPFGDDHDHDDEEGHGEEGEEGHDDEHGEGKPKTRKSKYGALVNGEHIEDAGGGPGGAAPPPSASFLSLADDNSSHFSPENIKQNFKPKHLLAMDLAREAWGKRNPGKKAPDLPEGKPVNAAAAKEGQGAEPGAAPSARMHDLPPTGAKPTGADPTKGDAGPATPATHASNTGKKAGEPEEAKAWMTSAFAAHFLTDAFAGGHLVSGVEARQEGPKWYAANKSKVQANFVTEFRKENPKVPAKAAELAFKGIDAAIAGNLPGVLLKPVHDSLNKEGVSVRNAKGTEWNSKGDASLAASPATRKQAELSTKASRDAIQECLDDGTAKQPYAALDYIPDVANILGTGYRPIEVAAKDKTVYHKIWDKTMASGPAFYVLAKGYVKNPKALLINKLIGARNWALEKVDDGKKFLGDKYKDAKKFLGEKASWLKGLGEKALDKAKDFGSDAWAKLKEVGSDGWAKIKALGAPALEKAKELGSGFSDWAKKKIDDAREAASPAIDWAGDKLDKAKEGVGKAGSWLGDKLGKARDWAGEKVDSARKGVGEAVEGGSRALGKAWDTMKQLGSGPLEKIKQKGGEVGSWLSDTWDTAKKFGEEKVAALADGAKKIGEKISSGATDVADKAVSLFKRARAKAGGLLGGALDWLGEKKDELLGKDEGPAPSGTEAVSEVSNQTYAHGGFMGAAGAMMQDPVWSGIYQTLMPEDFAKTSRISEPEKLMAAMENNPVLNAYGSVRHGTEVQADKDGKPDAENKAMKLEWDVWLPPSPAKVSDLSQVKIAHGDLGTTLGQQVGGDSPVGLARDDVKNAPSGGKWMDVFGKAVAMYRATKAGKGPGDEQDAEKRKAALEKLAAGVSGEEALSVAKEYLGDNGGLILDVKSTYSTAADIKDFVAFLRGQGINVFGVGTFKFEQLEGLDDKTRKVKFLHGINGLENAAASGDLKKGDDVMFNAAALLSSGREYVVAGKKTYSIDQGAFQRVSGLQRQFELNIGLYVQESAASPDAIQAVTEHVNKHPEVYSRGFAYGNVSGSAEAKGEGSGFGAQSGADLWDAVKG